MSVPYGYIYRTVNLINGHDYIGQSIRLNKVESYLGSGTLLFKAIDKYGRRNFKKTILSFAYDEKELDFIEKGYIAILKPTYNIDEGGVYSGVLAESTKNKMSASHKGRRNTVEHNLRISESKKGSHFTLKHRKNLSLSHLGRKLKDETKIKLSIANTGKPKSDYVKLRVKASHSIAIRCVDKNIIYSSLSDASRAILGNENGAGNICACLKGRLPKAYGYHWEYVNAR